MPMPRLLVEPNTRFGKLVIVREILPVNKARVFLTKCDCGKYAEVRLGHLTSSHTRSCGCLVNKKPKPKTLWQKIVNFITEQNPEW
jgi:hypothetical protein